MPDRRFDYSHYADQATRLESLLASADEQLAFRRLRAAGLARTGKVVEAFDEYLKLRQAPGKQTAGSARPPNPADDAQRDQLEAIDEEHPESLE